MVVYKICRDKFAQSLTASGVANRWNRKDEFVLYAGSSISLATLEMVAHRSSIMAQSTYKLMAIEVADDATIQEIPAAKLPKNWRALEAYSHLQDMGSVWYWGAKSLLLKVPSAIVPQEFNYVINTHHPDFSAKVKLLRAEDFTWDMRLL